jgi:outer membrane protein assembly factor BamB
MKEAWSCKINFDVENVAIGEDYIAIGSGSYIYCIDVNTRNIAWKKKMIVTFYRDPFSDVAITAVDARGSMIAVGTNFMDGKVYLFTKTGNCSGSTNSQRSRVWDGDQKTSQLLA